jgi:hypothetical protein
VSFSLILPNERAVLAGLDDDLARRGCQRLLEDIDASSLVIVLRFQPLQGLGRPK